MDRHASCNDLRTVWQLASSQPSVEAVLAAVDRQQEPAVLDSVRPSGHAGRYTIVACLPAELFTANLAGPDPFEAMREHLARTHMPNATDSRANPDLERRLNWWEDRLAAACLSQNASGRATRPQPHYGQISHNLIQDRSLRLVERAKEYIAADSDLAAECDETCAKALGVRRAMAKNGGIV